MRKLSEPLQRALDALSSVINVALPAKIESYDYTKQLASVKPQLKKRYASGSVESMPIIPSVPVMFPRSGGAQMTLPVKAGDFCLIICTDRSIDDYLAEADETAPSDNRQHDLTDAVAMVGFIPFQAFDSGEITAPPNNDDVLISYDGSEFILKPNGQVELNSTQLTINSDLTVNGTLDTSSTISAGSSITATGDVTANGVSLETHVHTGVTSGGDISGPPQ